VRLKWSAAIQPTPTYPLWYWLGKSRVLTTARNLPKTLAALAGLTLLSLVLIFFPADFRMTCEGTLLPESRRNVFANASGVVKEVLVDHGEPVEKDQPLVLLENIDLSQQIQTAKGKSEELRAMIRSARTALSDRRNQDQSRDENITALEAQLKSVEREIKLLSEKEKRLTIVSPIQGSVVTYDVRDILKDRPVERVESLMEVADLSGSWQLELNLPDRKIGHVIQAFKKNDGEPLEVGEGTAFETEGRDRRSDAGHQTIAIWSQRLHRLRTVLAGVFLVPPGT